MGESCFYGFFLFISGGGGRTGAPLSVPICVGRCTRLTSGAIVFANIWAARGAEKQDVGGGRRWCAI